MTTKTKQLDSSFAGTTLSEGTLLSCDLLPRFMFFLEEHDPEKATSITTDFSGEGWPYSQSGLGFGDYPTEHPEEASWLMDDLIEALNDIAPDDCYFGAHVGDGACFGFWPPDEDDAPVAGCELCGQPIYRGNVCRGCWDESHD